MALASFSMQHRSNAAQTAYAASREKEQIGVSYVCCNLLQWTVVLGEVPRCDWRVPYMKGRRVATAWTDDVG